MNVVELANYGVGVFAIGCMVWMNSQLVNVIKNHIAHSTKASQRLADMIEQMLDFLQRRK